MLGGCSIGIDFGTTNTVVALARPGETVRAIAFRDDRELSDLYRSLLCFEHLSTSRHDIQAQAGIKAIRAYLTSIYESALSNRSKAMLRARFLMRPAYSTAATSSRICCRCFSAMRSPMLTDNSPIAAAASSRGGRSRLSALRPTRRSRSSAMARPIGGSASLIRPRCTNRVAPPIITPSA